MRERVSGWVWTALLWVSGFATIGIVYWAPPTIGLWGPSGLGRLAMGAWAVVAMLVMDQLTDPDEDGPRLVDPELPARAQALQWAAYGVGSAAFVWALPLAYGWLKAPPWAGSKLLAVAIVAIVGARAAWAVFHARQEVWARPSAPMWLGGAVVVFTWLPAARWTVRALG